LAELADRVTEVAGPSVASIDLPNATPSPASHTPQPTVVNAVESHPPTEADFKQIMSRLEKLQTTVIKTLTHKLVAQTLVTTSSSNLSAHNCLLHIHNPTNHLTFLIDTGAAVSVIPRQPIAAKLGVCLQNASVQQGRNSSTCWTLELSDLQRVLSLLLFIWFLRNLGVADPVETTGALAK